MGHGVGLLPNAATRATSTPAGDSVRFGFVRASLLIVNADVRTMDSRVPTAQAVAIDGGVVLEVGPAEIAAKYTNSDVVDVGGRLVLPGFVDAHHHLSVEALHPIWVDLTGATDAETIVDRLRRAAESPGTGWIRGCQWNSLAVRLSRDDLDAVGTDRPILVACGSFHRGLVSSAGIDTLGLGAHTEDPPGGRFGRDAAGVPNGFLREAAWGLAHAATIRSFGEPERWGDLIVDRCRELLHHGITAVHDTTVSASAAAVYASLASSRRLPISVLGFPHAEEILTGMDDAAWELGPTGEGNERYRTGPIKLFADGAPDFAIDACIHGQRIEAGILFPQMRETMHRAFERGFAVAVHAMGNLALRNTIAAWQEAATASTPPLRIEHATLAGPNEVAISSASARRLWCSRPSSTWSRRWPPVSTSMTKRGCRSVTSTTLACSWPPHRTRRVRSRLRCSNPRSA